MNNLSIKEDLLVQEIIDNYLNTIANKNTRQSYRDSLLDYLKFCSRNGKRVISITSKADIQEEIKTITAYLDFTRDTYSSSTLNTRLCALKGLYKYCHFNFIIPLNPMQSFKGHKVVTEKETIVLSNDEMTSILDCTENPMERMIVNLLAYTGLRKSEICNIKMTDFATTDSGTVLLTVIGKGRKKRIIALNENLVKELSKYMFNYRNNFSSPGQYLIVKSFKGAIVKLAPGAINYIVEKCRVCSGIDKPITPHSFRASLITHLLHDESLPIRDVSIMAGHSSIMTTERYDKGRERAVVRTAAAINYGIK